MTTTNCPISLRSPCAARTKCARLDAEAANTAVTTRTDMIEYRDRCGLGAGGSDFIVTDQTWMNRSSSIRASPPSRKLFHQRLIHRQHTDFESTIQTSSPTPIPPASNPTSPNPSSDSPRQRATEGVTRTCIKTCKGCKIRGSPTRFGFIFPLAMKRSGVKVNAPSPVCVVTIKTETTGSLSLLNCSILRFVVTIIKQRPTLNSDVH